MSAQDSSRQCTSKVTYHKMVLKSWKKVNKVSIFFALVCIKQLEVARITCYAGVYGIDALTVSSMLGTRQASTEQGLCMGVSMVFTRNLGVR
jgi:hypothetical protein